MILKDRDWIEPNTVEELEIEIERLENEKTMWVRRGCYTDARELEYMISDLEFRVMKRKEQDTEVG